MRTDLASYMKDVGQRARIASTAMAKASTATKNAALIALAVSIRGRRGDIRAANLRDVERARASGVVSAMLDRLQLSDDYIEQMAAGL